MFLLIDKPKGITSHDVVDEVRKITGEKKVGHAGTLDPNATGLLIIGIGRESTKKLGIIAKETTKRYDAEIYLGEEKDTDDSEGVTIAKVKGFLPPSENEVKLILVSFLDMQNQMPPAYSAIKIKGKKSYELARKGQRLEFSSRKITVYSIKLVSFSYPLLFISCCVSSGTYIRALARDIGKKIGCGAYLIGLKRTEIGKHKVEKAVNLNVLDKENWKNFICKNI